MLNEPALINDFLPVTTIAVVPDKDGKVKEAKICLAGGADLGADPCRSLLTIAIFPAGLAAECLPGEEYTLVIHSCG
jgi:hypothetical protein